MSDEDVRDFVNRFMPAYHAYLPRLYTTGVGPQPRRQWKFSSSGSEAERALKQLIPVEHLVEDCVEAPVLKVSIDRKRLPVEVSLL